MKIEALIELECAVIMLPVLAEELEEPLGRQLVALFFLLCLRLLAPVLGKGGSGG